MTYPIRIGAAALLLAALLVGLVVRETAARAAGREVILVMQAVDPRELLTGHYAALDLTQAVAPGRPCPPGTGIASGRGWVALTPGATDAKVTGYAKTRDAAAKLGPVVVRGQANCWAAPERDDTPGRVSLDLGIRRFHADQKQAEGIEKTLRDRKVGEETAFAVVSVGQDGKPRLKGVIIDGHRMDLSWK